MDRPGPSGSRRAGLAQPLPAGPHSGDRALGAEAISHLLGTRTAALLCVHGAHIDRSGLHADGVAIVPAGRLRDALGHDRVLSDGDVELLATTLRMRLRPAA
jgi:hypothetical protein